jgi:carboxyl-terminal processing protease
MARYYTPSDMNIDKIGIPPDLEIKNLKEFS